MSIDSLASRIVSRAPARAVIGTTVTDPTSGAIKVDIGGQIITSTVPGSLQGVATGQNVRVSMQGNTSVVEAVLDDIDGGIVPTGAVIMWFGAAAPDGWLICDGSSFSSSTYPRLYAHLGGTTLPDFRDRVPMGKSGTKSLNSTGGAADVTLAGANIPPHYHATGFTGATIREAAAEYSSGSVTVATTATPGNLTQTDTDTPTSFSVLNPYRALNFIIKA